MFLKHVIPVATGVSLCLLTAVAAGAAPRSLLVAADQIELTKAQQELDMAQWQLQVDRENHIGRVRHDQEKVTDAMEKLQKAQLKLQIDQTVENALR